MASKRYPADPRKTLHQRMVECCIRDDINIPLRHCEKILPTGFARALAGERERQAAARAKEMQDAAPEIALQGDMTTNLANGAATDDPIQGKSKFDMTLGDMGQAVKDSFGSAFFKNDQGRQPLLGGARSGQGMRLGKPGL